MSPHLRQRRDDVEFDHLDQHPASRPSLEVPEDERGPIVLDEPLRDLLDVLVAAVAEDPAQGGKSDFTTATDVLAGWWRGRHEEPDEQLEPFRAEQLSEAIWNLDDADVEEYEDWATEEPLKTVLRGLRQLRAMPRNTRAIWASLHPEDRLVRRVAGGLRCCRRAGLHHQAERRNDMKHRELGSGPDTIRIDGYRLLVTKFVPHRWSSGLRVPYELDVAGCDLLIDWLEVDDQAEKPRTISVETRSADDLHLAFEWRGSWHGGGDLLVWPHLHRQRFALVELDAADTAALLDGIRHLRGAACVEEEIAAELRRELEEHVAIVSRPAQAADSPWAPRARARYALKSDLRKDVAWAFLAERGIFTEVDLLLALAKHERWTSELALAVTRATDVDNQT